MKLFKICINLDTRQFKKYVKNGYNINVNFYEYPILNTLCYNKKHSKMILYMIKSNVMLNKHKIPSIDTAANFKDELKLINLFTKYGVNLFENPRRGTSIICLLQLSLMVDIRIYVFLQILI